MKKVYLSIKDKQLTEFGLNNLGTVLSIRKKPNEFMVITTEKSDVVITYENEEDEAIAKLLMNNKDSYTNIPIDEEAKVEEGMVIADIDVATSEICIKFNNCSCCTIELVKDEYYHLANVKLGWYPF